MKKREKLSPNNNSSNNLCPPPRTGIINIPSMTDKEAKRKESKGDKPKAELLSKKDSKLDSLNRRETLGRNEHFQRSGGTMSRVRKSLSFAKDRRSSVSMALIGSTVGGKNRYEELTQGTMATLKKSPALLADDRLAILRNKTDPEILMELMHLVKDAEDMTFSTAFFNKDGVDELFKIVQRTAIHGETNKLLLGYALQSIVEVMEPMPDQWGYVINNNIIKKVAEILTSAGAHSDMAAETQRSSTMMSGAQRTSTMLSSSTMSRQSIPVQEKQNAPPSLGQHSLAILDCVVRHKQGGYEAVRELIRVENIVDYINDVQLDCALNALSLINGIFTIVEDKDKFHADLRSLNIRGKLETIIRATNVHPEEHPDMSRLIYEFQHLYLNLLQKSAMTPIDRENEDHLYLLNKLRVQTAFHDNDNPWLNLGFTDHEDPFADFMQCPPGNLALLSMVHFATKHQDKYNELIIEQLSRDEERKCPYVQSAIAVTALLHDQLRIGRDLIIELDYTPRQTDPTPTFVATIEEGEEEEETAWVGGTKVFVKNSNCDEVDDRFVFKMTPSDDDCLDEESDSPSRSRVPSFGNTLDKISRIRKDTLGARTDLKAALSLGMSPNTRRKLKFRGKVGQMLGEARRQRSELQIEVDEDMGIEINFLPVIFSQDNIFYELFAQSVQLFNRTWHEMQAKKSDFNRVVDVVREQLNLVFKSEKKISNTEQFRTALADISFVKIQEQRMKNLEKDSRPIKQLREKLRPELQILVNEQRLAILEAGELFATPKRRERRERRNFFCRLSPNHKVLHYDYDIEKDIRPSIEELQKKVNITDLEDIILWKDQPRSERRQQSPLGFSLSYSQSQGSGEGPKPLEFIAQTVETFSFWTDGIRVLLKRNAENKEAQDHLSMLLEMELKIRQLDILDIEGFKLPDNPPPIPALPDNYNFHFVM